MSIIRDHLLSSCFSEESIEEVKSSENIDLYKVFPIKQKGKTRVIEEPIKILKIIQQSLIPLFSKITLHPSCMAKKGKSILDNANQHMGAENLLKVDIRKCYPSITIQHLVRSLTLIDSDLLEDLEMLSHLCFIQKDDKLVLPTGAPTSPILCNIALYALDLEIEKVAMEHGYTYTRYIDDMIFSNQDKERHWNLKTEVEKIVKSYNLMPNFKKSKWARPTDKMVVTGVRLNGKSRVPKDFSRLLRAKLQNLAKEKKDIDQETRGCLAYVQSIDPDKYDDFMKYYERRVNYGQKQVK